jgi:hypothetical protein
MATSTSGASAAATAIKLRDDALAAAQKLEEAASPHSNTERSKQLQTEADLLKSAAATQDRVRAAADALEKERAQADALEQQAAALRDRLRTPSATTTLRTATIPPSPPTTPRPSLICTARLPLSRTSRT